MKKALLLLIAMTAFNPVEATSMLAPLKQELIFNGDFAQNDCSQQWCIFKQARCVPGWAPEPQIQIGFGYLYSDYLRKQRVLELAPNRNSCARQTLTDLQPGVYQLKFEYGARKRRSFNDCQFAVKFNGDTLKTITPTNYHINTETIQVTVRDKCDYAELRFCGVGGENNSFGAFLKSVSFVIRQNLGKLPIIYNHPVLPPVVNPPVVNPPVVNPQIAYRPIINGPAFNGPAFTNQFFGQQGNNGINLPPGLQINSHSNQCFQRQYSLQSGQHEIIFDYQISSPVSIKESFLAIRLNNQIIRRVFPSQAGKSIRIPISCQQGNNLIAFCPVGFSTEIAHKIILSNVLVNFKRCVGQWSNDLIVNGGFEQNQCQTDWCIWNQQTFKVDTVPGWIASPQIQVGKGETYNKLWGNTWVSELDPNKNSCIKQKVVLKPGKHALNFDWSSRSGTKFASSSFEVRLNGQVIKKIIPDDCQLHQQNLQFQVGQCPAESLLEFCGTGDSDSYGALIDNVQLFAFNECATYSTVNC